MQRDVGAATLPAITASASERVRDRNRVRGRGPADSVREGLAQPVGGARGDRPAGMAQHEAVEPLGGRETETARQCRIVLQQGDQPAHREPARRHHHRQFVAVGKLQQPGRCAFDQRVVVDRAARARDAVERLEGNAEALAQGLEIGLLAQMAGGDQHPVGADADRRRALPGRGDGRGRQQPRHAVEFRVAAGVGNARAGAVAAQWPLRGRPMRRRSARRGRQERRAGRRRRPRGQAPCSHPKFAYKDTMGECMHEYRRLWDVLISRIGGRSRPAMRRRFGHGPGGRRC